MKPIPFLLMLAFILCRPITAAPIDSLSALRTAAEFAHLRFDATAAPQSTSPNSSTRIMGRMGHAYAVETSGHFILVADDDRLPAVLGYAPLTALTNCPPALRSMLASPKGGFAELPFPEGTHFSPVAPLLTTIRHQSAPYNNLCPTYRLYDGTIFPRRCIVGCVATAMEQILTYHRPVITLLDTLHGWTTDHYTVDDVLPGETVDTRLIRNNYDTENCTPAEIDAVARLSYWLGLAAHMNWAPDASGANSVRLVEPLRRTFGLPYVHYLEKRLYAPSVFWQIMADEVMQGRPVYYAGAIMQTGGHAFVIDGLDSDGLFHVNWGYGGDFDGYFRLDVLSFAQPADERKDHPTDEGFFADQEAIVVSTTPVESILPDTLQRTPTDVAIESITPLQQPMTGRLTAVRLHVRNTSTVQTFNSTFGIIENLPSDTALTQQGEWLALTACTLEPGEETDLIVDVDFTRTGTLLLSLTPDGDHITAQTSIEVTDGAKQQILTDQPIVHIAATDAISITQRFTNASADTRAAHRYTYDLTDVETQMVSRKQHAIYLSAGGDTTECVTFSALTPGHRYTLRLREGWTVVQTVNFTLSAPEGIISPELSTASSRWFSLDGRELQGQPTRQGIYLRRTNNQTSKIIIR